MSATIHDIPAGEARLRRILAEELAQGRVTELHLGQGGPKTWGPLTLAWQTGDRGLAELLDRSAAAYLGLLAPDRAHRPLNLTVDYADCHSPGEAQRVTVETVSAGRTVVSLRANVRTLRTGEPQAEAIATYLLGEGRNEHG